MLTRRSFLQSTALISGSLLLPYQLRAESLIIPPNQWLMPDEGDLHKRTWMAFGASEAVWGKRLLPEVQRNLATIALTIAKYEPVTMLVRATDLTLAKQLMGSAIDLQVAEMDDLWMRDTSAVFVKDKLGNKAAVNFNFNGWGNKQSFAKDAGIADHVAEQAAVKAISTPLVLEGGGIEVDGQGTAIISESCVLNANRNPGLSKADCESALKKLLGLTKIIWLTGIKGKDITDGHTDFYARFAKPGVVLASYDPDKASFDHAVTLKHLEILRGETDSQNRPLTVLVLEAPSNVRPQFKNADFAAGYIGFYLCNGAVIASGFGDAAADQAAKTTLQKAFPEREVVQINVDGIAAGGGSIHCTTQQEPALTAHDRVLNWGESLAAPQLLTADNKHPFQYRPYTGRFYPLTETYVGFNPDDNYFYGFNQKLWGNGVTRIDSLANLLLAAGKAGF